MFNIFWSHLS